MSEPISKEHLAVADQTASHEVQVNYAEDVKQQATIFSGNVLNGVPWVLGPEASRPFVVAEAPEEFIGGRLYQFKDWRDPKEAEKQGQNINPGLYVKVRPVDEEDLLNPNLLPDITPIIKSVLVKWAGFDSEGPDPELKTAVYLEGKRLMLVEVNPQNA